MKVSLKKQTNIIDVPEDGAVHLLEITSDGYFKYEVNYRTDPRKAIQNKSILVKMLASSKPITNQPQKILTSFNPDQLISNILKKSSNNKDQSRGQVSNVFFTYISDISAKIPNDKTTQLTLKPAIQTLVPEVTLKKDKLVKLKSVQEITNSNIIMPVLENNISTAILSPGLVRNTSIAKNVSLQLASKGVDPAQISGAPTRTIQSAKKVSGGVTAQPNPVLKQMNLSDVQKVSLTGNLVNEINPSTHLQLRSTDYVNVVVDSPRTTLDIQEYLYIPIGLLQLDEFFLVLQLTNNLNVPVQTITISVPHAKNVANLQIPTIPPSIQILQTGLPGKNVVQVKQLDPTAVGVAVYRKEIKKSIPNVDAAYTFIGNINATYGQDFQRMEDVVNNFNTILYRAIPYNSHNIKSGEFSSSGAKGIQRPRNANKYQRRHNFVSLLGEIVTNAISIEIRDIPSGVCLVSLLKRNLTIFEEDFSLVVKSSLITNEETSAPLFLTDNDVQEDRIYEYQVQLLYPDGSIERGANNLIIKYEPVTANIVETSLSKPLVVQNDSEIDVQFTLNSSLIPTNMDLIKSTLAKQGLLDFFQKAVGDEKEKLQNIIAYNVKRTNVTTGEVEDFGIISETDFSDKKFGKVQGVKVLEAGFEYRYAVTTYFRSAETTLNTVSRTVVTSQNQSYNLTPSKWYHPVTLNKGSLVSPNSLTRNHSQNVFSFGSVGNIVTTNVSLANILPSIAQASAQKFGKSSILVQWRIQGSVTKIDHFIVIMEMVGMRTVVGKSHNISESNYFQFVDNLTDGEHGKLTYYIVPVFYDFSRGTEVATNEVFI